MAEKNAKKKTTKKIKSEVKPRNNPLWVVLIVGLVLLMLLASLWVTRKIFEKPVVSQECPRFLEESPVDQPQGKLDPPVVPATTTSGGEEKICKYADGFDDEGKVVKKGTLVTGPGFVKPDRHLDWGRPVLVGETYITTNSDEVIWLLKGDNACVEGQNMFFSYWSKDHP